MCRAACSFSLARTLCAMLPAQALAHFGQWLHHLLYEFDPLRWAGTALHSARSERRKRGDSRRAFLVLLADHRECLAQTPHCLLRPCSLVAPTGRPEYVVWLAERSKHLGDYSQPAGLLGGAAR